MNCQELAIALDECDLHELPARERAAAQGHLAACAQCARDHALHQRLAALPIPPLPAERIAGWRALATPGAIAARSRGVARGRFVLIGTVAVIAAAAAVLVRELAGESQHAPGRVEPGATLSQAGLPPAEPEPAPDDSGGNVINEPGEPRTLQVPPPAAPETVHPVSILVQSLQYETSDPAVRTAVENAYATIIQGLGELPGVTITGPLPTVEDKDDAAVWALTAIARDGGSMQPPPGASESLRNLRQWTAMLRLKGHFGGVRLVQPIRISGFLADEDCRAFNAGTPGVNCDAAAPALAALRLMRGQMFPADDAREDELRDQFTDASRPVGERQRALADLAWMHTRRGQSLDADVVRVTLELIRASPDDRQRLALFQNIAGLAGPEAIGPLVDATSQHRDLLLRMEATRQLAKYYARDATARAALEWLASNDAYPRLRGVAQAALDEP